MNFEILKGRTITNISGAEKGSEQIEITCSDGSKFIMYHEQECCESVNVEDIIGDVSDIIGSEILLAEEVTNDQEYPEGVSKPDDLESFTWTFYKLSTIKGSVTLRWYGESNGYYSESVTFEESRTDR